MDSQAEKRSILSDGWDKKVLPRAAAVTLCYSVAAEHDRRCRLGRDGRPSLSTTAGRSAGPAVSVVSAVSAVSAAAATSCFAAAAYAS